MTRIAAVIACIISIQAAGQTLTPGKADSVLHAADLKQSKFIDSLNKAASLSRYRDSLRINAWADSLRGRVNLKYETNRLTGFTDSLRRIGLPDISVTHRTDSLLGVKDDMLKEVNEKQAALNEKVSAKYARWSESLRKRFNLDSAGTKLPGLPTTGRPLSLGDPATPTAQLPAAGLEVPQIPSLETEDFSSLGISADLKSVGGDLSIPDAEQLTALDHYLPEIPDPMKEINGQVAGAKAFKDNPADAVEKAAGNIAEVKQATTTLKEAEAMKQQSDALKAASQLNFGEGGAAVRKEAVNHLAGQEKTLQATMSQMAKYKKKYSSIGSLSEIPKNDWLPRNGLKGKPFNERFRMGMNLGYKGSGDTLIFDFYPNASYRITGRLEAGLGAIYRLRVKTEPFAFDQRNPVWGISSFVLLKAFKSVHLRCEVDGNSFPVSGSADRPSYRDWRWSFYTGIQTNFKISKKWTGNVQMLYNFDSSIKDGFPEKLAARTGVQYSLK